MCKLILNTVDIGMFEKSMVAAYIENKRNAFLFLTVSHNQCSRLPTDPARSQHNYCNHMKS